MNTEMTPEEKKIKQKENMKRLQREWYERNKDIVRERSAKAYKKKCEEVRKYKEFFFNHQSILSS